MIAISKKKLTGLLTLAIALTLAIVLPLTLFGGIAASPNEGFTIKGHTQIVLTRADGSQVVILDESNVMQAEGYANIAAYVGNALMDNAWDPSTTTAPQAFIFMAVGESAANPDYQDLTQLVSEIDAYNATYYSSRVECDGTASGGGVTTGFDWTAPTIDGSHEISVDGKWTISAIFIGATVGEIGGAGDKTGMVLAGKGINEAGVFNNAAIEDAGVPGDIEDDEDDLLCRQTFGTVTLNDDDTLQITWTFTLS